MATENRTPDDLQEAVAATLRRLRGEVRGPAPAAERVEPQLSAAVPQETPPPLSDKSPEPDLLSHGEPEIPPAPAERTMTEGAAAYRPGAYKEEVQPPRTRWLAYALSFAALIVFGGIVWWAYQAIVAGPKNGPVPTITADTTPPKVPPSDQQTTDASGQGKTVYDQISGTNTQQKPEVLLPAPETPQTPPPLPAPVPSSTDVGGTATTTTTTTDTSNSATATQTLIPPAAPLAPATTGNSAANTSSTDTSSTAPAATGSPATGTAGTGATGGSTTTNSAGTTTAAGSSGTTTATGSSGTTTTADAGTSTGADTTQPAAGADTAAPANTGSVTTTPATDAAVDLYGVPTLAPTSGTTSGTTAVASADTTSAAAPASSVADKFRIQLAALKSEAEASKTWQRILSKHSDVLGSLTVHIVKADLGSQGIYYRVQAGPFADKASATAACNQLKSAGQQCLVKP